MTDLLLDAVSFSYPGAGPTLAGVDLLIPGGQSLALIGANGSGKTTLLRLLNGLLRPSRGRVLIDSMDVNKQPVARLAAVVGLCFQDPERQIFRHQVRDEVDFGSRQLGASTEEAFARTKVALESVGLGGSLERHPGDLGETGRKLLTIASVLAMQTPVVVLDEPTPGLDRQGIDRIETIVADLGAKRRTVIAASHDMRFVAESFERVVLLDDGGVRLDGPPSEVFAEASWPTLREAGLEPPESSIVGARLGLGSTPTENALVAAMLAAGHTTARPSSA